MKWGGIRGPPYNIRISKKKKKNQGRVCENKSSVTRECCEETAEAPKQSLSGGGVWMQLSYAEITQRTSSNGTVCFYVH